MINELARQVHENAKSKGFFDSEKNIGEMLCLIHSEVSEALEADRKDDHYNLETKYRKNKDFERASTWAFDIVDTSEEAWENWFRAEVKNTFEDELADIVIRVMDLAAFKGINLEEHISMKMRFNATREHKHGKAY